jgi:hypothetical protein
MRASPADRARDREPGCCPATWVRSGVSARVIREAQRAGAVSPRDQRVVVCEPRRRRERPSVGQGPRAQHGEGPAADQMLPLNLTRVQLVRRRGSVDQPARCPAPASRARPSMAMLAVCGRMELSPRNAPASKASSVRSLAPTVREKRGHNQCPRLPYTAEQ